MKKEVMQNQNKKYHIKVPFSILYIGWTIIIIGLVAWYYHTIYNETFLLARKEAYKGYEKDLIMRSWATLHGGVYVPITETTLPNPYLSNIKERDIETPSGKKLTLLNPAYITRQTHEIYFNELGIRSHITSLKPIRIENKADKWEIKALKSFERNNKEFYGFDIINNVEYFRFMAPLVTTKGCLKCHESQGYKVGDIRGGISSSIKWADYKKSINAQLINIFAGYGIVWIIGFVGISLVKRRFIIYITNRDIAESEIYKMNNELHESKSTIENNLIEKEKLIKELIETKDKLEKINSEKDKLFSIIAHDLRSPFQGFIGLTELMAEGSENFSSEELSSFSKDIHKSASNLLKLLTNLLEWAKIQKGLISFNPKELNLLEIVNQNVELIDKYGEKKGINIKYEIPPDLKVFSDEEMLNSVLRNVLANAIKFTVIGGNIFIKALVTETKTVTVMIKDDGIGMNEDLLNKLFKPGEKVGRKGTDGEESTGLGLLLCKEFAERNGGKIWVESQINVGSTFYFTIPKLD